MKTKQMTVIGMLAAMCAVLGYISINTGNMKFTFESFPILIGSLLYGPFSGFLIGGIGTLIYQLLRFGVTATTPLWMLPYALCGLLAGAYAKKRHFTLSHKELTAVVILNELLITIINTFVLYIDGHIYGYYTPAMILVPLVPRFIVCISKAIVFSIALPTVLQTVRRALHSSDTQEAV